MSWATPEIPVNWYIGCQTHLQAVARGFAQLQKYYDDGGRLFFCINKSQLCGAVTCTIITLSPAYRVHCMHLRMYLRYMRLMVT